MEERIQKAFDFAADSTKQLIALATGIIALTITFSKDFIASVPAEAKPFAFAAWVAYVISVIFGIWTLLALTGTLESDQAASIRGKNVVFPSIVQIVTFGAGTILSVIFGIRAVQ